MVTCPLVPSVPHLISGSCSSPRAFGLDFLQTQPRDRALALLLAFGSTNTWRGDLHPTISVPCLAHTLGISGRVFCAPLQKPCWVQLLLINFSNLCKKLNTLQNLKNTIF